MKQPSGARRLNGPELTVQQTASRLGVTLKYVRDPSDRESLGLPLLQVVHESK
jgi:hypothetical protein